jgi:glycyl-tRNA synthetase beta chain
MDPDFLDLPPEVIRTSMRVHQRYFAVRDPKTGKLAPHFVTVANIDATDGGKTIAKGNAKVLRARLSDARFFWTRTARPGWKTGLEKLKGVTFHAKLGAMYERVERLEMMAAALAPASAPTRQGGPGRAPRQGRPRQRRRGRVPRTAGRSWAATTPGEGLSPLVAEAIRDHYKPAGAADEVPDARDHGRVAGRQADTLTAFFAINEKPTGSRDPFALRRARPGVIRILLASELPRAAAQRPSPTGTGRCAATWIRAGPCGSRRRRWWPTWAQPGRAKEPRVRHLPARVRRGPAARQTARSSP